MKTRTNFYVMALVLFVSIFVFSCKKDSSSSSSSSTKVMKYDGKEYSLSKGASIRLYSYKITGYPYALIFASSGVQFKTSGSEMDSVTGTGNGFEIILYSSDGTSLASGTYVYNAYSNAAGTFEFAEMFLNHNFSDYYSGELISMKSGTLTVSKSGSTWELSFTGISTADKQATLTYKGSISSYVNYP